MEYVCDLLVAQVAWLHLVASPYTKVEESFNLHAIHDILMYGVGRENLQKYDHFVFPGAVPRTFIGSIGLAWIAWPFLRLASAFGLIKTKLGIQLMIRGLLATLNVVGLCCVRRAAIRRFGPSIRIPWTLLTVTQFHIPFWLGRTVPNAFALFFVNLSTYLLLDPTTSNPRVNFQRGMTQSPKRVCAAIALLTFAATVFRGELALYLAPLCLVALLTHAASFIQTLLTGGVTGVLSAALTISVDSYFWKQNFLWPELHGIYFNVVEGKSAEWGVSPYHTYFSAFLPKLLLASFPLCVIGFVRNRGIRILTFPSWSFVALLSFLGHKEWRFVMYVVPILNVAAAVGSQTLSSAFKRPSPRSRKLLNLSLFLLIISNAAFTLFSTLVSAYNYPGGEAMRRFHQLYTPERHPQPVHVHICNLAAQTGASLFTQLYSPPYWGPEEGARLNASWVYTKTEGLWAHDLMGQDSPFTHLIVEDNPWNETLRHFGWKLVDSIEAFDGIKLRPPLVIKTFRSIRRSPNLRTVIEGVKELFKANLAEKLWILERSQNAT